MAGVLLPEYLLHCSADKLKVHGVNLDLQDRSVICIKDLFNNFVIFVKKNKNIFMKDIFFNSMHPKMH